MARKAHIATRAGEHDPRIFASILQSVYFAALTGRVETDERINGGTLQIESRTQAPPSIFLRAATGKEPVREWLKALEPEDRRAIGEDIEDVEFSWPIGMPLVRPLGRELWEVRASLLGGRTARVLFCVEQGRMVLLHGFIKKTRKTPQHDIDLALRRKKEGDA
jgi:phage-related protein